MKNLATVLGFCLIALSGISQELRWEFVNAAGLMDGDSASLRWTIGESFSTEVNGTTASLRVGFLPFAYVEDQTSASSNLNKDIEIVVSPNPASNYINVRLQEAEMYVLRFIAQNGSELFSTNFTGSYKHDISGYPNGAYTIIVIDALGAFNTTTIVKI